MEAEDVQPPDNSKRSVRYSDSPQRWTRITETVASPVRSVHPEHSVNRMDSINSQADFGHRNTDFFEDESSDDEPVTARKASIIPGPAVIQSEERAISPIKALKRRSKGPPLIKPFVSQCEPKGGGEDWPLQHSSEGYHRLESNLAELRPIRTSTPSTTYSGSVDEFLEDLPTNDNSNNNNTPRGPKPKRSSSARTPRSSGNWRSDNNSYDPMQRRSGAFDPRMSGNYSEKVEQRLGIHAIAHEVYLQGLFRDEELLRQHKMHALSPSPLPPARVRDSGLPSSLRPGPPRSPPTVPPRPALSTSDSALGKGPAKKVHLVPPPMDLSGTHHSLPEDLVRTPYPRHTKAMSMTSTPLLNNPSSSEATLTVSIQRAARSTAKARITTITIPTPSSFSVLPSTTPTSQPYDDAAFFLALRHAYTSLVPLPLRLFSARSLRRIQLANPAEQNASWSTNLRSYQQATAAREGQIGSFDAERALAGFRKPKTGKGKMAFVGWAQQLHGGGGPEPVSATDETPIDAGFMSGEGEESLYEMRRRVRKEGEFQELEFVVGWSWRRISLAVAVVLGMAIAALLLWVFLGTGSSEPGSRIGAGALLAVVVFLVGMGLVGVWLGISWIVV